MANLEGETITLADGRVYTWHAAGAVWDTAGPPSAPPVMYLWELAGSSWQPLAAPPPPDPGDFPDASNTGPSGTLTPDARTQIDSTVDGQVFENLDVTNGFFFIRHNQVTIRNCRIHSDQFYAIEAETTDDLQVEDCRITGIGGASGIGGGNSMTVRRCDISGFENGIFFGGVSVIEDNYIHGLASLGGEPHFDGMQTGGCTFARVRHNTIVATDTSHVFLQNSFGPVSNVKVLNNQFIADARGAPSANVYANTDSTAAPIDDIEIAFNVGDRGFYSDFDISPTVTNVNIHDNTLTPPAAGLAAIIAGERSS